MATDRSEQAKKLVEAAFERVPAKRVEFPEEEAFAFDLLGLLVCSLCDAWGMSPYRADPPRGEFLLAMRAR